MNTLFWAIQIILCIKFLSTAYTHGLRQDQPAMQQAAHKLGASARPLLAFIAIFLVIDCAGLILPAAFKFLPFLTPLAAAALAFAILVSIALHLKSREKPQIPVSLVLFVLSAALAYGRWVVVPL